MTYVFDVGEGKLVSDTGFEGAIEFIVDHSLTGARYTA